METVNFYNINPEDEVLNKAASFVNQFNESCPLHVIDMEKVDCVRADKFLQIFVKLKKQILLENFVDMITERMSVFVLFTTSRRARTFTSILYSKPVMDNMYIIKASSYQHGIVNGFSVCFFNSIENMYHHVMNFYNPLKKTDEYILEKQNEINIYRIFMK